MPSGGGAAASSGGAAAGGDDKSKFITAQLLYGWIISLLFSGQCIYECWILHIRIFEWNIIIVISIDHVSDWMLLKYDEMSAVVQ